MIIIKSNTSSVQVGTNEFPKNTLSFDWDSQKSFVSIRRAAAGDSIIAGPAPYTEYMNSSNVPYASLAALLTDLRTAFFA